MIAICFFQVAIFDIYAQKTLDAGVRARYNYTISPRWNITADGSVYKQFNVRPGIWGRLSLKGEFMAMERRYLYMSAIVSRQEYNSIKNHDTEFRLVEGFNIITLSGFSHSYYLSQRQIYYEPTGDKAFCSDITFYQQYSFKKQIPLLSPFIMMSETVNITPDISNAPFLQRFRVGCGASFTLGEHVNAILNYSYAMGSKRQIFIGDSDGLNFLTLALSIKH